jgi:plasmid stability protein
MNKKRAGRKRVWGWSFGQAGGLPARCYDGWQGVDGGDDTADLFVRGVDEKWVKALQREAAAYGRSAEAEHLAILPDALLRLENRQFIKWLMSMTDVGEDADFERIDGSGEAPVVFD